MAEPEVGYFTGSGGIVFDFYLPLPEIYEQKVVRGELVRVNADGSPYGEPSDPVEPAKSAPKGEWVGYARLVDPDLSIDDADAMTKNDLIEKYGSK